MPKVSAHIGKDNYKTDIISSTGNKIIADEPKEDGGKNLGFSPLELLAAALSACTCATVRMYADRKKWDLKDIKLEVEINRDRKADRTYIRREMKLNGSLSDTERAKLLQIANRCPVHKALSSPIKIETELV